MRIPTDVSTAGSMSKPQITCQLDLFSHLDARALSTLAFLTSTGNPISPF
jgi:hypothetical protein